MEHKKSKYDYLEGKTLNNIQVLSKNTEVKKKVSEKSVKTVFEQLQDIEEKEKPVVKKKITRKYSECRRRKKYRILFGIGKITGKYFPV